MTTQTDLNERPAVREFIIARTFDVSRERMWQAWTERARLMQWFGPKGFTMPAAKLDSRPGGWFHYCLCAPDGNEMWGRLVYREIVAPERIVLVSSFSDEDGRITRHPMIETWPLEMLCTFTFSGRNGRTTVSVKWVPINVREAEIEAFERAHEAMEQGWSGTFEQLAAFLAKTGPP